jgi:hypothetical protein
MSTNLDHRSQLLSLPAELLVQIYHHATSFADANALSSTCVRMKSIWSENIRVLYKHFGPRYIEVERHALKFRQDQRGSPFESKPMTTEDVTHILRNAKMVAAAVKQFEKKWVSQKRSRLNLTQ